MKREEEIVNAQITDTFLGREDHGILTFYVYMEFQGGGVRVGGYALDRAGKEYLAEGFGAISEIIRVVGADSWEDLRGRFLRVKSRGLSQPVTEIGNLMHNDWFDIAEYFKEVRKKYEVAK